jgi:hypothetical protein
VCPPSSIKSSSPSKTMLKRGHSPPTFFYDGFKWPRKGGR